MGVIFKKNGRPTKVEKGLLKNINNFLSSLDESERDKYGFNNETITNGDRLSQIWDDIIPPTKKDTVIDGQHGKVDTNTGEIFDRTEKVAEEETNFVNNNESMEEAEIITETEGNVGEVENAGDSSAFFNPLKEPIKKRVYQKTTETDVGEIDEPDFTGNKSAEEKLEEIKEEEAYNEEEHKFHEEEEEEEKESHNEWDNLSNPKMEELDNKDSKLAAKKLVQTVLDGYEMLHELGKHYVKYPEDKIQEKAIKGEIDPTMEIPIDENGTTTNPIEFFQNFNEQAEEAISYDPEFGEKVRPAMERVFAKKGWGMTDEQFLMVAFGKDMAWKSVQIINLKKTAKGIMTTFEQLQSDKIEAMRQEKRAERRRKPPLEADSIVTPPKTETKTETYQDTESESESESRGYYAQSEDVQEEVNQNTDIVPIH